MAQQKSKAGSKGKYERWLTDEGLQLVTGWARRGLTDEQIAHNCGITAKTLYEWKKKFSKFCEALKNGKEVADIQVENALYKRAVGYQYQERTVETSEDGTKVKVVTKEMAPDVTAQIFWLKNRQAGLWRDKPTEKPSGSGAGGLVILPPVSDITATDDETVMLGHEGGSDDG